MNLWPSAIGAGHLTERIQRRLRTARARARYRFGIAGPDPGTAMIDPQFLHPVEASSKSVSPAKYQALFPDDACREVDEAGRLAAHRFELLGHPVVHGARIAWSLDPVSGREWSRGFSPDIVYRGPDRLGDIKLPWELNKHQYFFTLGKASWITGDAAGAIEIVRQIDHWIQDNPYQQGIHWISALETGARAIAWIMAYPFYADRCDGSFQRRLATSLALHMRFVEQHLSTGTFTNTHLIGEAAALVAGGLFLRSGDSSRWLAMGLQLLEDEIDRQVTADGVYAERSVAYHRFFLDHYYLVAALLAANRVTLAPATLARVEQMTSFLMHVVFPDGTIPDFGDADDARGLWTRADAPADYRGLLALGAVLFGRADFKAASGGMTDEVFWLFGLAGVSTFEQLSSCPAREASVAFPEAGYYVMWSGRTGTDSMLVFDCGPLGSGPAVHGHADALSFQLHSGGYSFFVDSGTYSYNLDYSWRDEFRSTGAHNTVVVDGEGQSVPKDRMSWAHMARADSHSWITTPWFDLADGSHDGYERLPDPVRHRRVVVFLKPNVWLIWDDLSGRHAHTLQSSLHLRPDCDVNIIGGDAILTSPAGHRLNVCVFDEKSRGVRLEAVRGDDQRRDAWFSPGYGTRTQSSTLKATRSFVAECSLITCCSSGSNVRPIAVHGHGWMHARTVQAEESRDILFYRTHGAKRLDADGCRFDGTLLFARRKSAGRPVVWARAFHTMSLDGVLQVATTALIDSLVFTEGRCEIRTASDSASHVQVSAPDDIEVIINGQQGASSVLALAGHVHSGFDNGCLRRDAVAATGEVRCR